MFERIVAAITRAALWIATLACFAGFALVCYAVIMREVFRSPLSWDDEVGGWLMLATVMFAAAAAQKSGEHVAVDSLLDRAGPRVRRVVIGIGLVLVAAAAVIMTYEGWATAAFSRSIPMLSDIGLPLWWFQALVPLGFVLLLLVVVVQLIRLARGLPVFDEPRDEGDSVPRIKAGPLE